MQRKHFAKMSAVGRRTFVIGLIAFVLSPLPNAQVVASSLTDQKFLQKFLAPPSNAARIGREMVETTESVIAELKEISQNLADYDEQLVPLKREAVSLIHRVTVQNMITLRDIRKKNELIAQYRRYFRGNEEQQKHTAELGLESDEVAVYWCTEYGVDNRFKIFSGGLGILAGDTAKGISDFYSGRLDAERPEAQETIGPFVQIGLAYSEVYQEQTVDEVTGYPRLRFPRIDYEGLKYVLDPQTKQRMLWDIPMPGEQTLHLSAYVMRVGRTKILLVTSDIPENDGRSVHVEEYVKEHGVVNRYEWDEPYRRITDRLYTAGSATEKRFLQQYVLGIGGSIMLGRLGLRAKLHHLNEGHSALCTLDFLRQEIQAKQRELPSLRNSLADIAREVGYTEADLETLRRLDPNWETKIFPSLESSRQYLRTRDGVTSHTPVPAGNPLFDRKYFDKYIRPYFARYGQGRDLTSLIPEIYKHVLEPDGRVNFTTLAIFFSDILNGVSRQNEAVTNKMYRLDDYRKGQREGRTGFTHVTNAVHRCWEAPEWRKLKKAALRRLKRAGTIPKAKTIDNLSVQEMRLLIEGIPDEVLIRTKNDLVKKSTLLLNDVIRRNRIITKLEWEAEKRKDKALQAQLERLRKMRLADLVRDEWVKKYVDTAMVHGEKWDPEAFTVTVARRFATYKQSDLSLMIVGTTIADQILQELTRRESSVAKGTMDRAKEIEGQIQQHERFIFETDAWIMRENGYVEIEDRKPRAAEFGEAQDQMRQRARAINSLLLELEALVKDIPTLRVPGYQHVFAGLAHPLDESGAKIISRIMERTRASLEGHVFFVEGYDIEISQLLQGASTICLNNPEAPKEAAATSWAKHEKNGTLGVSRPDGGVLEAPQSILLFNRLDQLKDILAGPARVTLWRTDADGNVEQVDVPVGEYHASMLDPNVWCCYNPVTNNPEYPELGDHPKGSNSFHYWISDHPQDLCSACGHWAIRNAPYQVRGLIDLFKNRHKREYRPHWANLLREALIDGAVAQDMRRFMQEYHEKIWLPLARSNVPAISLRDRLRTRLRGLHDTVRLDRYRKSEKHFHGVNRSAMDGKKFPSRGLIEVVVEVRATNLQPDEIVPVVHYGDYRATTWMENDRPMEFLRENEGRYVYRAFVQLGNPGDYGLTIKLLPPGMVGKSLAEQQEIASWLTKTGGPVDIKFKVLPAGEYVRVEQDSPELIGSAL